MSTASKPLETQRRRSSDPVSWYLATIGRIPLLTPAEEIELGNQVQAMMALTEDLWSALPRNIKAKVWNCST